MQKFSSFRGKKKISQKSHLRYLGGRPFNYNTYNADATCVLIGYKHMHFYGHVMHGGMMSFRS